MKLTPLEYCTGSYRMGIRDLNIKNQLGKCLCAVLAPSLIAPTAFVLSLLFGINNGLEKTLLMIPAYKKAMFGKHFRELPVHFPQNNFFTEVMDNVRQHAGQHKK